MASRSRHSNKNILPKKSLTRVAKQEQIKQDSVGQSFREILFGSPAHPAVSQKKFISALKKSAKKYGVKLSAIKSECPHGKIINSDSDACKNIKRNARWKR